MSDMWEKESVGSMDNPDESTITNEPEDAVKMPTVSDLPSSSANQVDSDGSFQYVPPHNITVQPSASQPHKDGKERGWIVIVAILAALAVLISGMTFAFDLADRLMIKDKSSTGEPAASDSTATTTTTKPVGSNNAPDQLQQNAPPVTENPDAEDDAYCDNGYTTEYIVNKNYNSTVVLTMYTNMDSLPYYGGGGLQEVGAASGIVWTADGYIITNCHCVIDEDTGKKYDRIDVTTYDGTVYKNAQVIGADESTDLAVIKVDATDLKPAEFGDSDQLAVGSRVVALGNAAGLSWTATQGILSAKARDVYEDTGYAIQCLQVDVAINSGNSGGPLLNKFGQVVGINSVKIAASGYEGLGFSIPINEAKPVLESLAKNGYVTGRVSLGISGDTYDDGFYQGFGIVSIDDATGWEGGNVEQWEYNRYEGKLTLIVAVNDVKVVDYGTLRAELAKYKVGDTVTLKLLHFDQASYEVTTHYVKVTLKEQTSN